MSSASDGSALVQEDEDAGREKKSSGWQRSWCLGVTLFVLYGVSIWILLRFVQFSVSYNGYFPYFRRKLPDILDGLDLDCDGIENPTASQLQRLAAFKFQSRKVEEQLENATDKCTTLRELFSFPGQPLSSEEESFPLAYGLVVYKNFVQVLFMLSSFYQPQNEYCIAVSGSAAASFKKQIRYLPLCFPNIHILERPPIHWGSFEIINSTYTCLEFLARRNHSWRYFQYLSGVDAPLKTNLEMVRIFRALNGSVNVEIKPFHPSRANGKNLTAAPLPFLYKASLSALIPRQTADFFISNSKTREVLKFLQYTAIPDESFWATMTGNINDYPVPGGFDGQKLLNLRNSMSETCLSRNTDNNPGLNYYVSRRQLWLSKLCQGKESSGSCVYGIKNIGWLLGQPHLVAHKFYLDYQPAGYFCLLKAIKNRTRFPATFDATPYGELPQNELHQGVAPEKLRHPAWLC